MSAGCCNDVVVDRSRFGTFLKNSKGTTTKLKKDEKHALADGDLVQFGTNTAEPSCTFRVSTLPTVFCMSNMKPDVKKQVSELIAKMGNLLYRMWLT